MGILNITPDSFSDSGLSRQDLGEVVEAAKRLADDGAAIIDIGGQSTRPGADLIAAGEECNRVIPLIRQDCPLPHVMLHTVQTIIPRVAK